MELKEFIKYKLTKEQEAFFSFLYNPEFRLFEEDYDQNEKEISLLINRHRLVPFFFKNKEKLTFNIQNFIKRQYLNNAQRMLLFAGEMIFINQACGQHNIKTVFLKGPALAYDLHNDFSSRQMVDLDIYIEKEALKKTHGVLLKLGYKPTEIPNTGLRKFILKDNYYFHPEKKVSLEIHYRFFPNKYLDGLFKKAFSELTQTHGIKNVKITVLSTNANLIFLVLHGSNHQWFRLFWLKDLADFILQKQIIWPEIIAKSEKLGITKMLVQSVVLANLIFNAPIPSEIQHIRKNDKVENYLIQKAVNAIISPINENVFKRIERLIYLSRLCNKWKFKWHTIVSGALRFAGK